MRVNEKAPGEVVDLEHASAEKEKKKVVEEEQLKAPKWVTPKAEDDVLIIEPKETGYYLDRRGTVTSAKEKEIK